MIQLDRVPPFYHRYIGHVIEQNLDEVLSNHLGNITPLLETLPEEKWSYRYAPGKWTIAEMVQHLIDAERVFVYRALCFSRQDATPLPSFDEDSYALHSEARMRGSASLLEELKVVQQGTVLFFKSLTEEQLDRSGIANHASVYVRAIAYIIAGHVLHHKGVLEERYL